MNIIIYDITHLIHWRGNLTGIPRTTDEIGRRLLNLDNVVFVSWDMATNSFKTVNIRYYYDEVDPVNRNYFRNNDSGGKNNEHISLALTSRIKRRLKRKAPSLAHYYIKTKHKTASLFKNKTIKNNRLFSGSLEVQEGDIFFTPCGVWDNNNYINQLLDFKKEGCKLAFLCYDMLPIVVPQFSGQWGKPMEDFTKRVVSQCDIVFAISQYTKKDLTKWLKANKLNIPKVSVIHLGDTFEQKETAVPTSTEFIRSGVIETKEPFILCTGTMEARKNHTLLYYTYKLAKSRGIDLPKLIIAGRPGHRTENIINIIQDDPDVSDKMYILPDTTDEELAWLYKNCKYTIYPSFYEGWGLPIAESIVQGVPCLCSNTSSMPEVAPGIADSFNPSSPDECLGKILEYQDPKLYKTAVEKTKQYKPTSWDYTYSQIIDDFEAINNKAKD